MALADVVLGSTVANAVGGMGSTITLNCDFLAGVKPGTRIEGEAVLSRKTGSVAFVSGRLFSGDTTFMTASGIWKIIETSDTSPHAQPGSPPAQAGTIIDPARHIPLEPLETGADHPCWRPARDVKAPEGYISQPLGDPFEAWIGPFFVHEDYREADPEKGELEVAFQIDDRHVNASGICHGGMFLTFADATLGMVPWRVGGVHAVTLSLQSQFLKPGRLGDWVITRPRLIRKTPSIIFTESTFEINDEIVFAATSLWKVIGK